MGMLVYTPLYSRSQLYFYFRTGSGAFVSLLAAPMIAFGEPGDVGRRIGMCFTVLALGALIGPPISGAIITAHGYVADGIYAGM